MKEVVFSVKLLPGEKRFLPAEIYFTVDFILIGKYLLAGSLRGGGATSLDQPGTPSLSEDPEALCTYAYSRNPVSFRGGQLNNGLLLIF